MGCCGSRIVNEPDEFDDVGDIPHVHAEDADVAVKLSIDVDPSTKAVLIVGASSDFHLKYTLGDVIGKGGFSIVYKAVLKASGVEYAVKCIQRDKLDGDDLARMAAEVNALAQLKHPNILHLFDFFAEEHFYYIVTEYLQGGELFQRLIEKTYYTQQDAKNVVRTLLETIQYCHAKGFAHRDLKPENILLTSMYDDASVKLGDFGLATLHHNRSSMVTRCGSPLYLAPEILHLDTPYGKECDIWSIGVITFMLLSGCPPFYDDNVGQLYSKIKCGQYAFEPAYYWSHVSNDAKHLISCMLQVYPSDRGTAEQLLAHAWFQRDTPQDADEAGDGNSTAMLSHALNNLRTFHARSTLKRAINTVQLAIAMQSTKSSSSADSDHPDREWPHGGDKTTEDDDDEAHDEGDSSSPTASVSSSAFESYHFTRQGIDPREYGAWSSELTSVSTTTTNDDDWL